MMLAARYADWWNVSDKNYPTYKEMADKLRQNCENIGRDPSSLRLTWFGRVALGKTEAEAQARGSADLMKWTTDNAFVGTPGQVVEQIRPFVELGVDYFMLDVLGLPNQDVVGMLLEDVLPYVKGKPVGGH
jgi:alkanesulfonate monooxygenase SsuD/methylene tetrahydromethanopterin reductase-like flavin-dependent oxidoreductase (luciferase family)